MQPLILQKLKTELKDLKHSSHTIDLSKVAIFGPKKADFCQINSEIRKINGVRVLNGIFFETKYVSILTYQISSFYLNSNGLLTL